MGRMRGWVRHCALAASLALFVAASQAPGQTQSKQRTLGVLAFSNPVAAKAYFATLADELRKRGWIEGRNLVTKLFYADGDIRRMDALAAELVALKPDVIYTTNPPGALALQRATRDIPIVFSGIGDPVGLGLVKSLRQPGANITGFAGTTGDELFGKRLQLLKEWLPQLTRLAVMLDPNDPNDKRTFVQYQQYGSQMGIQLSEVAVRTVSDIDAAFKHMEQERPDALYVFSSAPMYLHRELIASRAIAARIPTMTAFTQLVDAGAMAAYAMRTDELARQGARYVDLVLRGAKPANLPIEQPSTLELVINLKTVKAIGVTIPPSILLRADRVIE